jgi:hypothetical protein
MLNDRTIAVEIKDYMTLDKLNLLSVEYSTPVDVLVNIAVKRLLDDIAFAHELRKGNLANSHDEGGTK